MWDFPVKTYPRHPDKTFVEKNTQECLIIDLKKILNDDLLTMTDIEKNTNYGELKFELSSLLGSSISAILIAFGVLCSIVMFQAFFAKI